MGKTFQEMGWQDRTVKVARKELLKVLQQNREQHIKDYDAACNGYRVQAVQKIEAAMAELKQQLNSVKADKRTSIGAQIYLPTPVSHERSYNQIIKMMEMSVEDIVELTAGQFACFVMDNWDWRQEWETSNAPYFGGVRAQWKNE